MSTLIAPSTVPKTPPRSVIESALNAARLRIQVTPDELDAAKERRSRIASALRKEFVGGRIYYNGSVAHGDALNPLTDIDLGVVVPNEDGTYGPGRLGPAQLQERAAAAIRRELGADFPNLEVIWRDRKRSILVRFRDPVTLGQADFTADVIIAIDNPVAEGLLIPRYDQWDRSAPETHTAMVTTANEMTRATFARVVRLLKRWSRTHERPLCSWNIKALALGIIYTETTMVDGLRAWFSYAIDELSRGETEDPAGVAAEPIHLPEGWTRRDVLSELREASQHLQRAVRFEDEGYPALALDELAKLFRDPAMMPSPDGKTVVAETVRRDGLAAHGGAAATSAAAATQPAISEGPVFPRRAWGLN
jgi:hypothetical protein